MQIDEIHIENFRIFENVKIKKLPRMAVFVGANGSGKSTLFDVLSFLKDALTYDVTRALNRRGGFKEVVSRGKKGPIRICIKFRESGGRLATYELTISSQKNGPVVEREILKMRRGSKGLPWHFIDFSHGKGTAITNQQKAFEAGTTKAERVREELESPDTLALKSLGQLKKFPLVLDFRQLIDNWHISDIHIGDMRESPEEGLAEHLSKNGANIAQVAQYLYEQKPKIFEKILKAMAHRVPGISKVEAEPTVDGRLVLKFQDGSFKDPFIARYVSDGTIKMFAYLVLLYDPKPFPLLAVEEPENQLYPTLMMPLAEEFRSYASSESGQVFVSTHSPEFLNALKPEELYCLQKENGFTRITSVGTSKQIQKLYKEGDLLGYLWNQGLLEGLNEL